MTQEEKQLLLQDICTRLPHYVKIKIGNYSDYKFIGVVMTDNKPIKVELIENEIPYKIDMSIENIKPYLRSMGSMTEEEREEFEKISHCFLKTIVLKRDKKCRIVEQKTYFDNETPSSGAFGDDGDYRYIEQEYFINSIDWLNAYHFDYRGLIKKGLALKAPEGMYN